MSKSKAPEKSDIWVCTDYWPNSTEVLDYSVMMDGKPVYSTEDKRDAHMFAAELMMKWKLMLANAGRLERLENAVIRAETDIEALERWKGAMEWR